jgi:Kef-type K+ transport system membrane component KefB
MNLVEHLHFASTGDAGLFRQIAGVIVLGAVVALIMRLLKQPLIIGHILTGVLIGLPRLNFIHDVEVLQIFSKIGVALLLFIIGLGLNPKVIRDVGKPAISVGLLQVVGITILVSALMLITGQGLSASVIVGVCAAFSSTIVILKLISDKREQGRLYGKLAIGILIIQDVVATISLLVLGTASKGGSFSLFFELVLKGIIITAPLILLSSQLLPKARNLIAGSQEFLFLFALAWGFGVGALYEMMGFSLEIGALVAGAMLAPLPYAMEMSTRLKPLRDFFVVIFFISLGLGLNIGKFGAALPYAIIISVVVFIIKPLFVLAGLGYSGFTKNTSFKTASTLGQLSEFSLVFGLIAYQQKLIDETILTALTLSAVITIALSSYAIVYADKLYQLFEKHLHIFERSGFRFEHDSAGDYDIVQFGYVRGGSELAKMFHKLSPDRFVVVDYNPDSIELLAKRGFQHIYGDATDPELLDEVGLAKAKLIASTITDFSVNSFLVKHVIKHNKSAVIICHADTAEQATELYEFGASYVMMPHYIGSQKMSSFISKNGFKKAAFTKYREKHLQYIQTHYAELMPVDL